MIMKKRASAACECPLEAVIRLNDLRLSIEFCRAECTSAPIEAAADAHLGA
jgi:hypothetical protein